MGCSATGSAPGCYPGGWWFESTRPSHRSDTLGYPRPHTHAALSLPRGSKSACTKRFLPGVRVGVYRGHHASV